MFAGSSPITFTSPSSEARQKVRALCSAGITQPRRSYDPVRLPQWPLPSATLRTLPSPLTGLPRLPEPPFRRAVPTTPADRAGAHVDCFPAHAAFPVAGGSASALSLSGPAQASLSYGRRIAQPPKVTFVTRLQPSWLPSHTTRQLPDLSTIFRVESSSTGVSRLRGALPGTDQLGSVGSACSVANPFKVEPRPVGFGARLKWGDD